MTDTDKFLADLKEFTSGEFYEKIPEQTRLEWARSHLEAARDELGIATAYIDGIDSGTGAGLVIRVAISNVNDASEMLDPPKEAA